MKSIQKMITNEIIINKSKFINYLAPIRSLDDANDIIVKIKESHKDANHHCYAYILGDNMEVQKYSDDGEPSKTAGLPMLEVLKKNELVDVIIISVRYFGGIKLGAGGLVRAYTKSCSSLVLDAVFSYKTSFTILKISIDFDQIGLCEKHIRDHYDLLDTTYDTKVHYLLKIYSDKLDYIQSELQEKTNGKAIFTIIKTIEEYE